MTNHIPDKKSLAPCMRALLLKQVTSRMDITGYCNHFLHLELKQTNGTIYKGSCPWCGKKEVFFCHIKAGTCICESCETIADFFDIITTHWGLDLSLLLNLLAWQLEKASEFQPGTSRAPGQGGAV
jgi:hypothetical protein